MEAPDETKNNNKLTPGQIIGESASTTKRSALLSREIRTADENHSPVDELVKKARAGHVGSPVSAHVDNLFLGDDNQQVPDEERKEPKVDVLRIELSQNYVDGNGHREIQDQLHCHVTVVASHHWQGVLLPVAKEDKRNSQ